MEIKRYVCISTTTYIEQQAVLAKFPEAYFITRENDIVDFLLPIYEEDIVRDFLTEWNKNQKG